MSCDVPYWGMRARQSRPLIPSVKHHGDKSTALKGDMQGGSDFLLWRRCSNGIWTEYKHSPQRETTLAAKGRDKSRQAKQQNAALTHGAPNKEREGGRKERGLRGQSERIVRKWGEDCEKVARGLWEDYEMVGRGLWEYCESCFDLWVTYAWLMGDLWATYGRPMG